MTTRAVDYAQHVLDRYWDKKLPIDPNQIIQQMANKGITDLIIHYEPMNDCSGKIFYDWENKNYTITINDSEQGSRQRFTAAHELGHYFLNHGEKEDKSVTIFRKHETNRDEVEANAFAAELLMPRAIIDFLMYKKKILTVAGLADKLGVSHQAMRFRLKNLGLI